MRRTVLLIGSAIALGGCAGGSFAVRRVPSDEPAAQSAPAPSAPAQSAAAMSRAAPNLADSPPGIAPVLPADAPSMDTYDPWQRLNRLTYRFNARVDEAVLLRAADARQTDRAEASRR